MKIYGKKLSYVILAVLSFVIVTGTLLMGEIHVKAALDMDAIATLYDCPEDAAAAVKAGLKAHKNEIYIRYAETLSNSELRQIFDLAVEPTGFIEDEGDYLKYSVNRKEMVIPTGYYTIVNKGYVYKYTMVYYTTLEQEEELSNILKEQWKITGETELEKITSIYEMIKDRVDYYPGDDADGVKHSAYGACVEGSAVCDGYATLFYRVCLKEGIDCRILTGRLEYNGESRAHTWNIVLCDGYYYAVDTTVDDNTESQTHFLINDFAFKNVDDGQSYLLDDTFLSEEFKKAYPQKESPSDTDSSIVTPSKTRITKLTSKKKHQMQAYYEKRTKQTTGYQLQYWESGKSKKAKKLTIRSNAKCKRTISNLKSKKKYYVRVRTYLKKDGRHYYSSWSKKKGIRVK